MIVEYDRFRELGLLLDIAQEERQAEQQRCDALYAQMNLWQKFNYRIRQIWLFRLWKILSGTVTDKEYWHLRNEREFLQIRIRLQEDRAKVYGRIFLAESHHWVRAFLTLHISNQTIWLLDRWRGRAENSANQELQRHL